MTVTSDDFDDLFKRSAVGPLSGVVIADFGRVLAAPYCTMLLADLGATVLKVESLAGDETRSWMPPVVDGESTYYMSVNRNKHSIALDFRNPDDLEVAKSLAAKCDVLVENFKPGGLASFGLDYESVRLTNPTVVYASITGFGTKGGVDLPGYDLLVQGAAGLMSLQGSPETEPFRAGVAVFDVFTGLHTSLAIMAALRHLSLTGEGQLIELNLMSTALSSMVNQTAAYSLAGVVPSRLGNEHPSIYPYSPFATLDGEIILAIGNDNQYRDYVATIGAPGLAEDDRFDTNQKRSRNRDELRPLLEKIMVTRTTADWFQLLRAAGLPCAPINDVKQGIEFAESLGLDPIVSVGDGSQSQPGIRNPAAYSRSPVTYDYAPPALDSSGEAIRAWLKSST
jgi:crotonobetainyl-CoA:carnitine CoA-transferase CaiB-like acyl-CoA transferase